MSLGKGDTLYAAQSPMSRGQGCSRKAAGDETGPHRSLSDHEVTGVTPQGAGAQSQQQVDKAM